MNLSSWLNEASTSQQLKLANFPGMTCYLILLHSEYQRQGEVKAEQAVAVLQQVSRIYQVTLDTA